jgi:membrane protein required for colicin V production
LETIDIILGILILFGAYRGYQKGFLLEIVGVLALILAIIGSFLLLDLGVQWVQPVLPDMGRGLPVVVFIILFIMVVLAVNLSGRVFKKIINLTPLGSVDNLVGAIVGALKWSFIISLFLWISDGLGWQYFDEKGQGAVVYPYVRDVAPAVGKFIAAMFPAFESIYDSLVQYFREGWV